MSLETLLVLKIITPEGIIFEKDDLYTINIPLADGFPIGIRPGHAPLLAETTQGTIHFRSVEGKQEISLHAGVLDIKNDTVTILTFGKINREPEVITLPTDTDYNRLMQTLVNQLIPDDKIEIE